MERRLALKRLAALLIGSGGLVGIRPNSSLGDRSRFGVSKVYAVEPTTVIAVSQAAIGAMEAFSRPSGGMEAMVANLRLTEAILNQLSAITHGIAHLIDEVGKLAKEQPAVVDDAFVRNDLRELNACVSKVAELAELERGASRDEERRIQREFSSLERRFDAVRVKIHQSHTYEAAIAAPVLLSLNCYLATKAGVPAREIGVRLRTQLNWMTGCLNGKEFRTLQWTLDDYVAKHTDLVTTARKNPIGAVLIAESGAPIRGVKKTNCSGYVGHELVQVDGGPCHYVTGGDLLVCPDPVWVQDKNRPIYAVLNFEDEIKETIDPLGALSWSLVSKTSWHYGVGGHQCASEDDHHLCSGEECMKHQTSMMSSTRAHEEKDKPGLNGLFAMINPMRTRIAYLQRIKDNLFVTRTRLVGAASLLGT